MNKNLSKAARIMKNGGIVIFPTDTAFGIGCRIDDERAVRRLFKIRRRPEDKAVLVLASSQKMAFEYVKHVSPAAKSLVRKYWPGGLTIVFEADEKKVQSIVRGGHTTIGIRVPAHSTVRRLIREVGVPILAPSANFSGEKTPYVLRDINPNLIKLVDFVMRGRCKIKKQSTVVDCSRKTLKILRLGAVKIEK